MARKLASYDVPQAGTLSFGTLMQLLDTSQHPKASLLFGSFQLATRIRDFDTFRRNVAHCIDFPAHQGESQAAFMLAVQELRGLVHEVFGWRQWEELEATANEVKSTFLTSEQTAFVEQTHAARRAFFNHWFSGELAPQLTRPQLECVLFHILQNNGPWDQPETVKSLSHVPTNNRITFHMPSGVRDVFYLDGETKKVSDEERDCIC